MHRRKCCWTTLTSGTEAMWPEVPCQVVSRLVLGFATWRPELFPHPFTRNPFLCNPHPAPAEHRQESSIFHISYFFHFFGNAFLFPRRLALTPCFVWLSCSFLSLPEGLKVYPSMSVSQLNCFQEFVITQTCYCQQIIDAFSCPEFLPKRTFYHILVRTSIKFIILIPQIF